MRLACLAVLCSGVSALPCPPALPASHADYDVVQSSVQLVDSVRERSIPTIVWKPSGVGPFPLVTINHGAGMPVSNPVEGGYAYLAIGLAARGYVVAGWNEYTMAGMQLDYILDSAAIRDSMYNASANSSDEFHGWLCENSVALGHSLGGGGEFVAADIEVMRNCAGATPCNGGYTAGYQGLAALSGGFKWNQAPADPYVTARRLAIPALFVSGTADCMVKPLVENYPMYGNMSRSPCRIFANVTGADHCQWAGLTAVAHAACLALERAAFSCKVTLSAAEQQSFALKYVLPFFESVTKGASSALSGLLTTLETDSANGGVIYEHAGCASSDLVV